MKRVGLTLLALALALAITPAARADGYYFSFSGNNAFSFHGSGVLDETGGVIDFLTGNLYQGSTLLGTMTLDPPGYFASNDNVFLTSAPWFDENGVSFNAGIDYNLYFYATDQGYVAVGCKVGQDCITSNGYGVTSSPINFSASPVPEPSSLMLLGIGLLGLSLIIFRKLRPTRPMVLNM